MDLDRGAGPERSLVLTAGADAFRPDLVFLYELVSQIPRECARTDSITVKDHLGDVSYRWCWQSLRWVVRRTADPPRFRSGTCAAVHNARLRGCNAAVLARFPRTNHGS